MFDKVWFLWWRLLGLLIYQQAAAVQRKQLYAQLCKRIERERQLAIIAQKLEVKRLLVVSNNVLISLLYMLIFICHKKNQKYMELSSWVRM
jgi:hypothetical protein